MIDEPPEPADPADEDSADAAPAGSSAPNEAAAAAAAADDAPAPAPAATEATGPDEPRWRRLARLQFLDGIVAACRSWVVGMVLVGVGPGLALWSLLNRDDPRFKLGDKRKHLIEIEISHADQLSVVKYALASLAVVSLLYAAAGWWNRRRNRNLVWGEYYRRLNIRLIWVMLLPVFSALYTEKLESDLQVLTLVLAGLVGLSLAYWHYQTADRAWRVRAGEALARFGRGRAPDVLAIVMVLAYTAWFGRLSVTDHHNLGTHVYDLALYDNTFWNTAHGDWMDCSYLRGNTHLSGHVDLIIIVLSPIYGLHPRAETLLWLQSAWLAMAGIPIYLVAKRHLDSGWQAATVLSLFLLAPALHGVNMFDFHSLALMVPMVAWLVYFVDAGPLWAYWLVLPFLLLTREDMPFVTWFIGIYALFRGRRRTGAATLVVATIYLFVIRSYTKGLALAGDEKTYSYAYYYEELIPDQKDGLSGLILTFFSDPIAAAAVVFKPKKLLYWAKVFGPLAMVPAFARNKWILYVYGLVFIGLVSRPHVYSVHFQYSSALLPFLLLGYPEGLARIRDAKVVTALGLQPLRLTRAILFGCVMCTLVVSAKFGAIVPNEDFRAGWNRPAFSQDEKKRKRYGKLWALIGQIPPDASVCSSTTIGPHVSNRKQAFKWPACHKADYVLMPRRHLDKKDERRLERMERGREYDVAQENDEFVLLRRVPDDERDARRTAARASRRATSRRPKPGERPGPPQPDAPRRGAEDDEKGEDFYERPGAGTDGRPATRRPRAEPLGDD